MLEGLSGLACVASPGAPFAPDAILDQIPGFGHANVGVNVHDLHAPSADNDLARFAFGDGRCGVLSRLQRKAE